MLDFHRVAGKQRPSHASRQFHRHHAQLRVKILHVEAGRHRYGGAQQVAYLLQGLSAHELGNVLICPVAGAIAGPARAHAKVYEIPIRGDLDIPMIWRIRRIIKRERPDVVHLHSRRGADTLGLLAALGSPAPIVISRRVDNRERGWLARRKYALASKVVPISHGIEKILLETGIPTGKIVCIRSAIKLDERLPTRDHAGFSEALQVPAGHRVIAVLAQLIERKGHRYLIDAMPEILSVHPNTRLLILGRGPEQPRIEQQIRRLGLETQIRMAGFREDLPRWLPCFDLVVHPALREGLGVALLEAVAAGVPIVASRAGGVPEIVRDGENGLLVPPADVSALAAAVIGLLGDPARKQAFRQAGRALVEREFSVTRLVDEHLALYNELLGGNRG